MRPFEYTAKGRYFKVYLDGAEVSKHTAEREAIESANEVKRASPDSDVHYTHEYKVEVEMPFLGANTLDVITPPNNAPTWTSDPAPIWIDGVGGSVNLNDHAFDTEGDALNYALAAGSAALPANVSLNANGTLTATSSVAEGTTAGIIVEVDDGVNAAVASNSFSITVIAAAANLIYEWTVETASPSFEKWPQNGDYSVVDFFQMHRYSCPPDYSNGNHTQNHVGDGTGVDIASGTGSGGFEVGPTPRVVGRDLLPRFRVKNSTDAIASGETHPLYPASGYDEEYLDHYDPASSGGPLNPTDETRQRAQLQNTRLTTDEAQTIPMLPHEGAERWISLSVYVDPNFPEINQGSGFMTLWGISGSPGAPFAEYGAPIRGWLAIRLGSNGFSIRDTWMADSMYPTPTNEDYRYAYSFSGAGATPSDLSSYFPDETASTNILGNLNKGGWTDFIFNFVTDSSEPAASNTGWCDLYMRQNSDAWVKVLEIRPKAFTYDSVAIEKGVGLTGAGYTKFNIGIYNSWFRVWQHTNSAVLYYDNLKIGDENATFEEMTPDGTSAP